MRHEYSLAKSGLRLTESATEETLTDTILRITKEKTPRTMPELVDNVHDILPSVSENEILNAVIKLQDEGRLTLTTPTSPMLKPSTYLKTEEALWFWLTLAVTFATVISVFLIPENNYPLVVIRYILGAVFVVWLPGYNFIKALFPRTSAPGSRDLDSIERVSLSVGMSLALVSLVGLLLNYTPFGIRLAPIILSLTVLTLTLATIAVFRENQAAKKIE